MDRFTFPVGLRKAPLSTYVLTAAPNRGLVRKRGILLQVPYLLVRGQLSIHTCIHLQSEKFRDRRSTNRKKYIAPRIRFLDRIGLFYENTCRCASVPKASHDLTIIDVFQFGPPPPLTHQHHSIPTKPPTKILSLVSAKCRARLCTPPRKPYEYGDLGRCVQLVALRF